MPNAHRRRRRDATVELSRVGSVYHLALYTRVDLPLALMAHFPVWLFSWIVFVLRNAQQQSSDTSHPTAYDYIRPDQIRQAQQPHYDVIQLGQTQLGSPYEDVYSELNPVTEECQPQYYDIVSPRETDNDVAEYANWYWLSDLCFINSCDWMQYSCIQSYHAYNVQMN